MMKLLKYALSLWVGVLFLFDPAYAQIPTNGDSIYIYLDPETPLTTLEFWVKNEGNTSTVNFYTDRDTVSHFKSDGMDPTEAGSQDEFTSDVILTRGSLRGLFNIAQESQYSSGSPLGTVWSSKNTSRSFEIDYTNWKAAMSENPPAQIGKRKSMHISGTDLCYDVILNSWGMQGAGGFSYDRMENFCWVKTPMTNAIISSGDSIAFPVFFDRVDLEEWGAYEIGLNFYGDNVDVKQKIYINFTTNHLLLEFPNLEYEGGFGSDTLLVDESVVPYPEEWMVFIEDSSIADIHFDGLDMIINEKSAGNTTVTIGGYVGHHSGFENQWRFESFSLTIGTITGNQNCQNSNISCSEVQHVKAGINLVNHEHHTGEWSLSNLQGKVIRQGALGERQVELIDLAPGVYFLGWESDGAAKKCRVIW